MLTLVTKIKLVLFAVLAVVVVVFIGVRYANAGQYFGVPDYYVVKVDLPSAGGLYTNADVTYRGVSVGRVGAMSLTGSGIQVDLDIGNHAPPIPADSQAVVADLSAVGEQYVDLRPQSSAGPYLTADDTIAEADTQIPAPVTNVLSSVDGLANSLPRTALQTLVNELYNGFNGQGQNLSALLNSSSSFTQAAENDIVPTNELIKDGQSVLATQEAETDEIESFASTSQQFAAQLDASDADLRNLISQTPLAAEQVAELLQDNSPDLGLTLANLLTASNVAAPRQAALKELLSVLPALVAAGNTVFTSQGANAQLLLTFFDPLPCTDGYGGTVHHNGDSTATSPLNTSASCTAQLSTGQDVRGSSHAPKVP
jgi:phospholipid/cholesterol/gamma-HCH transport system substrate-binding protein